MHLIFLATLLVSILSIGLHPSLASSGTYCNCLLAFLYHSHLIKYLYLYCCLAKIIADVLLYLHIIAFDSPALKKIGNCHMLYAASST